MTRKEKLLVAAEMALNGDAYRWLEREGLHDIARSMYPSRFWREPDDSELRTLYLCFLAAGAPK